MSEASSEPGCELQRPHDWIRYALPLLAVWLTYWLALFPGLISLDSVNQWGQIVTGRYDDWHPVFHTWVLWLLSRPGHSLGTVSLVQVVLTAVLLGHALSAARQLGVPGWLIWTAVAWFVLSPVFGVGTIAVWKDNAFGLTTLWTVVLLLRAVRRWTMTSASSLWFGIALALMSLFRHNGHLVAIPTLGVAAWCFRPSRVMAIRSTLVGVLLVTLVIGVTRAAHIPHAPEVLKQLVVIHQIAALVAAGTPLPEHSREVLERVAPLPTWASDYKCEAIAGMLYWPGLRGHLRVDRRQLVAVWAQLAARNPWGVARHWVCVTRYIWSPHSELIIGPLLSHGGFVADNAYGLATTSWLPWVEDGLVRLVAATLRPGSFVRFLVWQPAFPLYVLLGSLGLAVGRTRSAAPLVILSPALFNTLLWLGMATGPHFRFQWPVVLLAPVAACLSGTRQSARPASGSSHVCLQRSRRGAEAAPKAASPATRRPRPAGTPGRGQSPAVVSKAPRTRSAEKHSRATSAAWALARG